MAHDPLDGYRGMRPRELREAHENVGKEGGGDALYHTYVLGVQAEKLMAGVASRVEIESVMRQVVECAEHDCSDAMRALVNMPDLSTPEAKEAHMTVRTTGMVLTYLNDMIRRGITAGQHIESLEEPE